MRATRATVAGYSSKPLEREGRMRRAKHKFLTRHLKEEETEEVGGEQGRAGWVGKESFHLQGCTKGWTSVWGG